MKKSYVESTHQGFSCSFTSRQHVPGDGVSDGCEDPVELSERGSSVVEPARNPAVHSTTQMEVCQRRTLHVTQLTHSKCHNC